MVRRHGSLIQPTLFKRSVKEFVKEIDVEINELQQWFKLGWLSFNPKTQKSYDNKEYYEVIFIKGLVRLGLPKEKIMDMLSQLEKPYCYSYNDIYWDFNKNEWRELSQIIDKHLDNNMQEIVANNLDSYLEDLAEEGDKEGIERIIRSALESLDNTLTDEDEESFPWEDIIACRNKKKSPAGENELEVKRRLKGTVKPCPKCGKKFDEMELFYFESPPETWRDLCDSSGWIVVCIDCKKQIWYSPEVIS